LPYAAESFDLVLSSLVFHHLTCGEKVQAMREIHRVLAPGGEIHLGDFGEPDSRVMQVVSFLTEKIGREHVADNFAGMLMPMLEGAGFTMVEETGRLTSIFGVLRTIRAFKPLREKSNVGAA
jgi:SAM-dependent methyltransferase